MQREYRLVDGVFKREEAKEILMNILNEKIRFHDVQILRKNERNEADVDRHIQRVYDLKASREELIRSLSEDDSAEYILKAVLTIEKKHS